MNIKLTVYFEDPFWVGVFERAYGGIYDVSRVVFGSEPKDYEVYDFILGNYYGIKFSRPIPGEAVREERINPKRLQRQVKREMGATGIGTKAQQAMKLQQEASKVERKQVSRARKEEREQRKFELRQQKKKEKKKGH